MFDNLSYVKSFMILTWITNHIYMIINDEKVSIRELLYALYLLNHVE